MSCTSIQGQITVSTTIPQIATTKRRQNLPGNALLPVSRNICDEPCDALIGKAIQSPPTSPSKRSQKRLETSISYISTDLQHSRVIPRQRAGFVWGNSRPRAAEPPALELNFRHEGGDGPEIRSLPLPHRTGEMGCHKNGHRHLRHMGRSPLSQLRGGRRHLKSHRKSDGMNRMVTPPTISAPKKPDGDLRPSVR